MNTLRISIYVKTERSGRVVLNWKIICHKQESLLIIGTWEFVEMCYENDIFHWVALIVVRVSV